MAAATTKAGSATPDWMFKEKDVNKKQIGFGIGSSILRDMEKEKAERLLRNEKLITALGPPDGRKEFLLLLETVLAEDKRPMFQLYQLLNLKPYRRKDKIDEGRVIALIKEHPDLCQNLYRFEAFPKDLLHPFHMMCAMNASCTLINACYKACEAALFHDDSVLGAPIHYAVTFNAGFELIRWLVKKDLDALQVQNREYMTPLHLACLYEANAETVAFLTDRCAMAALLIDKDGMTPLHLACSVEEPQLAVTEDLTEVNAQACAMQSKDGSTPLTLAMKVGADAAVLKDLIVSNPQAVALSYDDRTGTSLHKAIKYGVDLSVLKDLIRADPQALEVPDVKSGNLPVHLAAKCKCNIKVFELLARKYPEGLEQTNKAGQTPTDYAAANKLDDEIVQFLNPFEEVEE
jgi:ankyrin repeat protein